MCLDHSGPAPTRQALHDFEPEITIALEPVDSLEVLTLMDNQTDVMMPDQGPARRPGMAIRATRAAPLMEEGWVPDGLIAEHGLSMLITVTRAGRSHRLLFDAGTSPDGVVQNMARLGIDPASIEAIVCSHGHFDHTAGLAGLIGTLGRTGLPVLIHPHFWNRRRVLIPGREPQEIPTTSRRGLTEAGFEVVEGRQPSFLFEGCVLVTGEVPRVTGYEPGFPPQQACRDGNWEPDPLVLDDQALVIDVRGKGLVVLTGCGHAGVVNISRYAARLTGDRPLYALLGGFHLNGGVFESLIPRVLDDLTPLAPKVLLPAHCTGWRARHAMAARFADAYVPNTVGTKLVL